MSKKIKLWILLGLVIISASVVFTFCGSKKEGIEIEKVKPEKREISNQISATGTIEAIKTVSVGTQVSGVINKIYVDFNSRVKKGQLLAEIDKTALQAQMDQSNAQVASAKADLVFQKANYERTKALFQKNLISQQDYDQAVYNLSKAEASYQSASSDNKRAKTNLDYAMIYSPIDGVVLNRAVDEGQTVAASFNTPELFAIANDLTQMEVQADIDEADIGEVRVNQVVDFTVDAFPSDHFAGEVTEIRLKPTVTSNVVTYTVIIKASNPDLKLMPGMTASVNIEIESAKDALAVPVKAFKFWPEESMAFLFGGKVPERVKDATNHKSIWVSDGQRLTKKDVITGVSDGAYTQIVSGLNETDEVVLSAKVTTSTAKQSGSPFMPKPPSQSNKKK